MSGYQDVLLIKQQPIGKKEWQVLECLDKKVDGGSRSRSRKEDNYAIKIEYWYTKGNKR